MKNEIGFFRWGLRLGGFWNRNQEFESRPKIEFGNQESENFEQETVDWINLRTKIRNSRFEEPKTDFDKPGKSNWLNQRSKMKKDNNHYRSVSGMH